VLYSVSTAGFLLFLIKDFGFLSRVGTALVIVAFCSCIIFLAAYKSIRLGFVTLGPLSCAGRQLPCVHYVTWWWSGPGLKLELGSQLASFSALTLLVAS